MGWIWSGMGLAWVMINDQWPSLDNVLPNVVVLFIMLGNDWVG